MKGISRRTVFVLIALAVVGFLLYRSRGVIQLQEFSWSHLKATILGVNGWYVLLAVMGIYGAYAIRAVRWARFSQHLGPQSFIRLFKATLIGFASLFLLGRAGEPVRPILIARREGVPISSEFGIYVLERICDLCSTFVIMGLSLLTFPNLFESRGGSSRALLTAMRVTGSGMLVALPVIIGFLIYFRLHGAGKLQTRMDEWRAAGKLSGWRGKIAGLLQGFGQGLQAIQSFSDLALAVGYTALHWGLIVVIYWLVSASFGGRLAEIGISGAMLTLAFGMVGSTLQLPGVGGGSQAACFVALSAVLGVEKEPAAAAAILIWLVTFAACSLAGIPLMFLEGFSVGELKQMAKAKAQEPAR